MTKKSTKKAAGKERAGDERQKAAPGTTGTRTPRKASRIADEPTVELLIDREGIHNLTDHPSAPAAPAQPEAAPPGDDSEELVVFAFRLSRAERDLIHAAAGSAKASRFVRTLAVAAARGDGPTMLGILDAVQARS
jgi:hypothetical protein